MERKGASWWSNDFYLMRIWDRIDIAITVLHRMNEIFQLQSLLFSHKSLQWQPYLSPNRGPRGLIAWRPCICNRCKLSRAIRLNILPHNLQDVRPRCVCLWEYQLWRWRYDAPQMSHLYFPSFFCHDIQDAGDFGPIKNNHKMHSRCVITEIHEQGYIT